MSELHVQGAYQKYRKWCERIGVHPAPFDSWKKTTAMIGDGFAHRQNLVGCFAGATRHPGAN